MPDEKGTPLWISPQGETRLQRAKGLPESWLQDLIHENPSCLPIDQIEPGIGRLVPVCRELPLPIASTTVYADNLFVTPEGNLVVSEVKLLGNSEARRKVVAQALEYATALFRLDYSGLEAAIMRAKFSGGPPASLYSLVEHADSPAESVFADRITRNLREGRIVLLIVGDEIGPGVEAIVSGLQAHANFHFTFALVEMPVFTLKGAGPKAEYIVVPRTLVKTFEVPRFTIRVEGESITISDAGTDVHDARKPSGRVTISSMEFFNAMERLSSDIKPKLREFLDELDGIGVLHEYNRSNSLTLRWTDPEGRRLNLGYIRPDGEIKTDGTPASTLLDYVDRLAELFGGEVSQAKPTSPYRNVKHRDGSPFFVQEIVDQLPGWKKIIEDFLPRVG